ncbi:MULTISPECIES: response regulator transcription factor [unclassified Agromyces]|uniref:response regulator transcription factor n=1 Tax=unclassified Agromyces TaxID=2639701 RepID=UPI0030149364
MNAEPPPRVLIADDELLFRDGLALLLGRSGFEVVDAVGDAEALEHRIAETACDLVIVDIRMPPTNTTEGIVAAKRIRAARPEVPVLVLSSHLEVEHALDLLAGGVGVGYLLKQRVTALEDFTASLHRLLDGETVIDPALVQELLQARRVSDPLAALTPRERDVLERMAHGRSNRGVARELHLTEASVEKYVHRILGKLGLSADGDGDHRRVLAVLAFLDWAGSHR